MTGIDWLGFSLAVLLIELTPGPNMAWLAALAMGEGRRAGLAATAGVAVGLFFNAIAAAVGLATFVAASSLMWEVLRWGGAAFLLWLAVESWRDAGESSLARVRSHARVRRHFLSGLLVNLFNPKALLFFIIVIPRFASGRLPTLSEAMLLAGISVAIATAVHLAIVLAGSGLHVWLSDPARTRLVRRLLALVLVGVAIWFAFAAKMPVAA